jgi:hypothetical protein
VINASTSSLGSAGQEPPGATGSDDVRLGDPVERIQGTICDLAALRLFQ